MTVGGINTNRYEKGCRSIESNGESDQNTLVPCTCVVKLTNIGTPRSPEYLTLGDSINNKYKKWKKDDRKLLIMVSFSKIFQRMKTLGNTINFGNHFSFSKENK